MIPPYRSLLVAAALLLSAGCEDHTHSAPPVSLPSTAPSAVTAQTPPAAISAQTELLADPETMAFASEIARELARELALDGAAEERVCSAILRSWTDVQAEVARRVEAGGGGLDPESLTELFNEREQRLNAEISASLDPGGRAAFASLTGVSAGGAR